MKTSKELSSKSPAVPIRMDSLWSKELLPRTSSDFSSNPAPLDLEEKEKVLDLESPSEDASLDQRSLLLTWYFLKKERKKFQDLLTLKYKSDLDLRELTKSENSLTFLNTPTTSERKIFLKLMWVISMFKEPLLKESLRPLEIKLIIKPLKLLDYWLLAELEEKETKEINRSRLLKEIRKDWISIRNY